MAIRSSHRAHHGARPAQSGPAAFAIVRTGFVSLVALVALTALNAAALAQDQAKNVKVDEVRMVDQAQTTPVVGRLVARQAGAVSARVEAPIEAYLVEVGDQVQRGDVLAVLNDEILAARRDQAVAAVRRAEALADTREAELALARQEFSRLEGLKNSAAFNQGRYDDARRQVQIAAAQVAEAKAAITAAKADQALAELNLSYATITAPYEGVVTRRMSEVGAYVRIGDPLVQLLSDADLEVEAGVPFKRIRDLSPGQVIRITYADDTDRRAMVRAILPEENPMTRTRTVRLVPKLNGKPKSYAAGESVTVHVPIGTARRVLSVDKDAVLQRRNQAIVFVVRDGTAQVQAVQLGEAIGNRFEVSEGLKEGDMVVVRGNERLRDGEPVNIGLGNDDNGDPESGSASPNETSRTPPDTAAQDSGTSG